MDLGSAEIAGVLCGALQRKCCDIGDRDEQDALPADVIAPATRADLARARQHRPPAQPFTSLAHRPQKRRTEHLGVCEKQLHRPTKVRVVADDALRCPLCSQDFRQQRAQGGRRAARAEEYFFLIGFQMGKTLRDHVAIFPIVADVSTTKAARRLNTTTPTVRALLRRGELKGQQVARGSRFAWLVDEASIASYIALHGTFDGTRRPTAARITALEHEIVALRAAITTDGSPSAVINQMQGERDDLRGTLMTLQDALARMRAVAELQRKADAERSAMIDHLLAASAAGERADALRRSAIEQLEDAVAAATQPAHLG